MLLNYQGRQRTRRPVGITDLGCARTTAQCRCMLNAEGDPRAGAEGGRADYVMRKLHGPSTNSSTCGVYTDLGARAQLLNADVC